MYVLPNSLAPMRAYRQFVLYRVQPSTTRPGKTDKIPIDPQTFSATSAHDSAIWMDVDVAATLAEAMGPDHGVGFVFTAADPFWFMDIDNCREGDGWNENATNLLQWFPGAAVEISISGNGLHVFGCGTPPKHKTRFHHLFEFYSANRFAALGNGAIGDVALDFTATLAQFVTQYLTPDAGSPEDWRDGPVPEWKGPKDDEELIRRILKSKSKNSAFGLKITPGELFAGDLDALIKFFPDPGSENGYNASDADSALAQHLAFWTGNDHARIQRLMERSALKREKWDRPDYLPLTITNVVNRQYTVCTDKDLEATGAEPVAAGAPVIQEIREVSGQTFAGLEQQIKMFHGCVVIPQMSRVMMPGGYLMKSDGFRMAYGGYSFPMDNANERVVRNAWECVTESQMLRLPKAVAVCFRPEHPPSHVINDAGTLLANMWWPIETPSVEGDVTPFLNHIAKLFPNEEDRALILAYMAAIIQYPGVKFQWAPLIQGIPGNGKTMLLTAIARAVGDRYTHLPNAADLAAGGAKFTGWLQAKLFIGIEEIFTNDKRDMMEVLKPLITNNRIEIQAKGQDQFTGDNRANFMACSNHKDAITKTVEDRRWGIFYSAQQELPDLARDGMDGNYMPDLWDWFEGRNTYAGKPPGYQHVTHFFRTMKIADELNPATKMHRAPATTGTGEAIALSMGRIEQEIIEAIEEGRQGFAGGWVSSIMLDRLLQHMRAERAVPPKKRRALLKSLGYDYHPALLNTDGRANNAVQPDMGKPRLYVKIGHPAASFPTPAAAQEAYTKAQQAVLTGAANFGKTAS